MGGERHEAESRGLSAGASLFEVDFIILLPTEQTGVTSADKPLTEGLRLELEAYIVSATSTHLFQLPGTTNTNIPNFNFSLAREGGRGGCLNENLLACCCSPTDSGGCRGNHSFAYSLKLMSRESQRTNLYGENTSLLQTPKQGQMFHR